MRRARPWKGLVATACASSVAVIGLAGCGGDGSDTAPARSRPAATSPSGRSSRAPGVDTGTGVYGRIPRIVRDVEPSVVEVRVPGGEGSGVVWSARGAIVTNAHVVRGTRSVQVVFADGSQVTGRVLAADDLTDLAVVKVDRTGLPAADFAAGDLPPVGSLAIAIGNPLGFENSVTAGVVSGFQRAVPGAPSLVDLVQTDAAISPGNSGGALVGPNGKVIGINVAYIPPTASAVSIGFAIPAPTVVDVVRQLLDDGTVDHAYLGVQLTTLTPQVTRRFDLGVDRGALVVAVDDGGPAAGAGIEAGDVITSIGGTDTSDVVSVLAAVRDHDPGDELTVTVSRDGRDRKVEVTLGDRPTG